MCDARKKHQSKENLQTKQLNGVDVCKTKKKAHSKLFILKAETANVERIHTHTQKIVPKKDIIDFAVKERA